MEVGGKEGGCAVGGYSSYSCTGSLCKIGSSWNSMLMLAWWLLGPALDPAPYDVCVCLA